jgi:hypothetical protein
MCRVIGYMELGTKVWQPACSHKGFTNRVRTVDQSAMASRGRNLSGLILALVGLGCLYVLEGSTLGARVISRRLESHFMLGPDSGAAFFNAYGEAVGRRWSEFRSFVTGNLSAEQAGETVKAAVETFESLLTWLKVPSRGMPDVVARVPPTATGS